MPRKPSIRYFPSRGAYYTQFRGRQKLLAAGPEDFPDGPTYRQAVASFSRLMAGAGDRGQDLNVPEVIELRVAYLESAGREATAEITRNRLTDTPDLPVSELRAGHVQGWLDGKTKCGPTTRTMALNALRTALRWAASTGHCPEPVVAWKRVQTGGARSRGRDHVLSTEDYRAVVSTLNSQEARDLVLVLWETGCRPAEAMQATASHYHAGERLIRYRWDGAGFLHKTAKTRRKDRVILLPPACNELVARLVGRYKSGVLLRNTSGEPWTNHSAQELLRRAKLRLGWKGRPVSPYSFRHTFATRWLLAGGSITILANLLGTSVAMLEKHYAHLDSDIPSLHATLARFMPPG